MPYTWQLQLGAHIPIIGYNGLAKQSDSWRLLISPGFKWEQNGHLNAKDSYKLEPNLGAKLQILPLYVAPYVAGQYTFTHQQFRYPTLFYANRNDHELQAEIGADVMPLKDDKEGYLTITPYFAYRHNFLNHEYANIIQPDYSFKGGEESVYMGTYLAVSLRKGESFVGYGQDNEHGIDKRWVPNFGVHFDVNFYGRTHIPSTLKVGDTIGT